MHISGSQGKKSGYKYTDFIIQGHRGIEVDRNRQATRLYIYI